MTDGQFRGGLTLDERKWQEMRELDEAAERAGGYVALPREMKQYDQSRGEKAGQRKIY